VFATVLHQLRSPQNVGSIVRTHVALGGEALVLVGLERPWQFKKGTRAFSRKLERLCPITYLPTDASFFNWCNTNGMRPVAVEIRGAACPVEDARWPDRPAIVLGNERSGLGDDFLAECEHTVCIQQHGPVGSLNVAIAHGIAAHEFMRGRRSVSGIRGGKYLGEHP